MHTPSACRDHRIYLLDLKGKSTPLTVVTIAKERISLGKTSKLYDLLQEHARKRDKPLPFSEASSLAQI